MAKRGLDTIGKIASGLLDLFHYSPKQLDVIDPDKFLTRGGRLQGQERELAYPTLLSKYGEKPEVVKQEQDKYAYLYKNLEQSDLDEIGAALKKLQYTSYSIDSKGVKVKSDDVMHTLNAFKEIESNETIISTIKSFKPRKGYEQYIHFKKK